MLAIPLDHNTPQLPPFPSAPPFPSLGCSLKYGIPLGNGTLLQGSLPPPSFTGPFFCVPRVTHAGHPAGRSRPAARRVQRTHRGAVRHWDVLPCGLQQGEHAASASMRRVRVRVGMHVGGCGCGCARACAGVPPCWLQQREHAACVCACSRAGVEMGVNVLMRVCLLAGCISSNNNNNNSNNNNNNNNDNDNNNNNSNKGNKK
eukprot:360995-Chlamydomonas_euryale.AAC.5